MSRVQALLLVTAIWAAIFLPGLGSTEIKGEEPRRILPGVEMLASGDWLVPHLFGRPYLRKPPLVNWAIALSIKLFRVRNEWTARLPSVLAVLVLVLTTVAVGEAWLGRETAVIAALLMMTNLGLLEKGRLAEIEAIYISLYGIAITCWLAWQAQSRSAWLTWLVPFIFLGLGMLAKGPVHLLFFYAVAVPVLWKKKELRQLVRLPHFCAVALMLAIFAAWAVPYFHATAQLHAAGVWTKQMEERVNGGGTFDVRAWLENPPRGLCNFLPWLLFLPLLWNREALAKLREPDAAMIRAARWPIVICFFGLLFIPGMLPRYTLPLLVPASLLLALVLRECFPRRAWRWALGAGILAGVAMIIYAIAIVPRVNAHDDVRPLGERINALVPASEALCVLDPGLVPALFYVRAQCVYFQKYDELPASAEFLFTRAEPMRKLRAAWREVRVLGELTDKNKNRFFVLQLRGKL